MAAILTGILVGMRPVGGVIDEGPRKGEKWNFISMEISDPRFGKVWSCQMRSNDVQFSKLVEARTVTDNSKQVEKYVLTQDYTGHKVKVTIVGQTAGEREIEDKQTGNSRTIIQIRTQVTNFRDLGIPEDEE